MAAETDGAICATASADLQTTSVDLITSGRNAPAARWEKQNPGHDEATGVQMTALGGGDGSRTHDLLDATEAL